MVKALSIHQPWASAIALGAKRIETRHWRAPRSLIGQPLLIHASKTEVSMRNIQRATACGSVAFPHSPFGAENYPELWRLFAQMTLGALVAIARLAGCITVESCGLPGDPRPECFPITERELALGNFAPGRFGWVLAEVRPLPAPIPWKGAQGVFEVPAEALPPEFRPEVAA